MCWFALGDFPEPSDIPIRSVNVTSAVVTERVRLDAVLAATISRASREHLWQLSADVLNSVDALPQGECRTGLVLGYVQSGKTTAMTSLIASARDRGYRLVIAMLGTTNLLLDQNAARISDRLGIGDRTDYSWICMQNPEGSQAAKELQTWLERGRSVLIPVLKHSGRLRNLAQVIQRLPAGIMSRTLIVDDEADQASLNTGVRSGTESAVYAAIDLLRDAVQDHAFIQFTATPYAPLLLDSTDPLFPRFVKFLQPGAGYTGGREFFVDHASKVLRTVPVGDEQPSSSSPTVLPGSLLSALWNFLVGAAILLETQPCSPPISMLVHASHKNDIQAKYRFMLDRELKCVCRMLEGMPALSNLPLSALAELERLRGLGVASPPDDVLLDRLRYVATQAHLWLLNSATAVRQVDWNSSPVHILVGGNKLDRGFTVEGLTVTYMNRPPSEQVDTIEQRARAFGYRAEFLPFCQFFASARTLKLLRDIVCTEYDLRISLRESVASGRSVAEWSTKIGLLIPGGARPTREVVISSLSVAQMGWHQLRRPSLETATIDANWETCARLGILSAPLCDFGRLAFRHLSLPTSTVIDSLLRPWKITSYSGGWRHGAIVDAFVRAGRFQGQTDVVLMEQNAGSAAATPRLRNWDDQNGFDNLFQGRDLSSSNAGANYPGDRSIFDLDSHPDRLIVQIHRVVPRDVSSDDRLLTLAVHLGDREIVRRSPT